MKKTTLIRSAALFLSLINQLLLAFGKNPLPFSDEEIFEGVSALATFVLSIVSWWKNNSFTKEAIAADAYLDSLKEEK